MKTIKKLLILFLILSMSLSIITCSYASEQANQGDEIMVIDESHFLNFISERGFVYGTTGYFFERTLETMKQNMELIQEPEQIVESTSVEPIKYSVTSPEMKGKKIPILMYHDVSDETWGIENLFVKPKEFEKQLQYLRDNGFQTITFEDLDHISDFSKPVMITFDDGYIGNYLYAFPLLKKYNMKATIFIISDAVWSKKYININHIKEMSDSGLISIQSHTKTHYFMGKAKVGEKLKEELTIPKIRIKEYTGQDCIAVAYPNGEWNENILPEIRKEYRYGLLKNGGTFVCGNDLAKMPRMAVNRNTTLNTFIKLVNN